MNDSFPRSLVNSMIMVFGDTISCMHLFWISKTFSLGKANFMFTEFNTNPKDSISFTGVSYDIFKFIKNLHFVTEKSMPPFLAKFLSTFGPLLGCRPKILLFLH